MLRIKQFSWASFFIGGGAGVVLGLILMATFVNYLISSARSGAPTDGAFLGSAIAQVRAGIEYDQHVQEATSIYGSVVSIGSGTLVLKVYRVEGYKNMTFMYDDSTKFSYYANDNNSTEMPLSSDTIVPDDRLTIYTNEPIGSVANQHAVKVTKL